MRYTAFSVAGCTLEGGDGNVVGESGGWLFKRNVKISQVDPWCLELGFDESSEPIQRDSALGLC